MSFKTHAAARCSARFKFKTPDCVELVIIDSATNEIFTILWSFRDQQEPNVTKKKRSKSSDEPVSNDPAIAEGGLDDDK